MKFILAWAVLNATKHSKSLPWISTWKSSIGPSKISVASYAGNILVLKETWNHIYVIAKELKALIRAKRIQLRSTWSNRSKNRKWKNRKWLTKDSNVKSVKKDSNNGGTRKFFVPSYFDPALRNIEFSRWFHEFSVTTNLRIFQGTDFFTHSYILLL